MSTVIEAIDKNTKEKGGNGKKKNPDLQNEVRKEFIEDTIKAPPAKPRGRPPKSKTQPPKTPKSKPQTGPSSAQDVIDLAKRKKMIKQLRALQYHFPEELDPVLNHFDPSGCSNEMLEGVLDSCEELLSNNIEQKFYPHMMLKSLGYIETSLFTYASYKPKSTIGKNVHNFYGLADNLSNNPDIIREIKIISARNAGSIPNSPWMRLFGAVITTAVEVFKNNYETLRGVQNNVDEINNKSEYKDL